VPVKKLASKIICEITCNVLGGMVNPLTHHDCRCMSLLYLSHIFVVTVVSTVIRGAIFSENTLPRNYSSQVLCVFSVSQWIGMMCTAERYCTPCP